MAEPIRVVWRALVGNILCGRLNKAYRLAFMIIFNIKVVVAYFPTLAPVGVVNGFQLL